MEPTTKLSRQNSIPCKKHSSSYSTSQILPPHINASSIYLWRQDLRCEIYRSASFQGVFLFLVSENFSIFWEPRNDKRIGKENDWTRAKQEFQKCLIRKMPTTNHRYNDLDGKSRCYDSMTYSHLDHIVKF